MSGNTTTLGQHVASAGLPHCLTRTQALGRNPGVANNVPSFVGVETLETNPRVPKLLHAAERYQAFSIPHVLEGRGPVLFKILRVLNLVDFLWCLRSGSGKD